jgi:hypothetical protein
MLFMVFVFIFLHSELDQCGRSNDNHDSHDFCNLVQQTIVKTSPDFFKYKLEFSDWGVEIILSDRTTNAQSFYMLAGASRKSKQYDLSDSYLHNLTILI